MAGVVTVVVILDGREGATCAGLVERGIGELEVELSIGWNITKFN